MGILAQGGDVVRAIVVSFVVVVSMWISMFPAFGEWRKSFGHLFLFGALAFIALLPFRQSLIEMIGWSGPSNRNRGLEKRLRKLERKEQQKTEYAAKKKEKRKEQKSRKKLQRYDHLGTMDEAERSAFLETEK